MPASGGPRLLTLGQLEALRDDLAERLDEARRALAERTLVEEDHRVRIEEMLLDPAAHRWERVTNADIGEPGCKSFHVRPRGGILGMFASWWRVVISSGCPLPSTGPTRGRARAPARCRRPRGDGRLSSSALNSSTVIRPAAIVSIVPTSARTIPRRKASASIQ